MNPNEGLVYIGKIVDIVPIHNADFIVSATVICGKGGKWMGIVKKGQFNVNDLCIVYLPDSLIPPSEEMKFMEKSNWRVKMQRYRGAPSEVLIMPFSDTFSLLPIGHDITSDLRVIKYIKPVPAHLQGLAIGLFPEFIPKTDEDNYQRVPELIEQLVDKPYYITEKADGSSTTAYRYKGHFGVCSRNLELERKESNGYWKVALHYDLERKLPEGIALQWETCGPGIQSNPMGFSEIDGVAFSGYNIPEHRFLTYNELLDLTVQLGFPMCRLLAAGPEFSSQDLEAQGEGEYMNGNQREGVVIRSQDNFLNGKPISFKVINLGYEK